MSIPVTLLPGTLPEGYCYPTDPQQYNVDIISRAVAFIANALTGVYASPTSDPPPVDQRDKVWFNTSVQRLYWFINGDWQRTYEVPADSGDLRAIEIDVGTYNTNLGADATGVGSGSVGQLWSLASEYVGRGVIGAGLIPTSTPPVTAALGDELGAYAQTITLGVTNLPAHQHPVGLSASPSSFILDKGSNNQYSFNVSNGHNLGCQAGVNGLQGFTEMFGGDASGSAVGIEVTKLAPVKAVNWVRRTGRIYVPAPF